MYKVLSECPTTRLGISRLRVQLWLLRAALVPAPLPASSPVTGTGMSYLSRAVFSQTQGSWARHQQEPLGITSNTLGTSSSHNMPQLFRTLSQIVATPVCPSGGASGQSMHRGMQSFGRIGLSAAKWNRNGHLSLSAQPLIWQSAAWYVLHKPWIASARSDSRWARHHERPNSLPA